MTAKILVVEDSATMRGIIAASADLIAGCEIDEVDGGFGALRKLPETQYDLVITDINMPDINGLELLSFIRRNPAYAETPVIVVTTEDSSAQREKCFALGATAVLGKPVDEQALVTLIQEALGGHDAP